MLNVDDGVEVEVGFGEPGRKVRITINDGLIEGIFRFPPFTYRFSTSSLTVFAGFISASIQVYGGETSYLSSNMPRHIETGDPTVGQPSLLVSV